MTPWTTIRAQTRSEAKWFEAALRAPRAAQEEQLRSILNANASCALGRRYGFAGIANADCYRQRVPVHRYEDLAAAIHATCEEGLPQQMVDEPVLLCEHTSGSTAAPRLIPYTARMLTAFQRAVWPWLHDLAGRWPELTHGRAYFAVSPALRRPDRTAAGIPLGADNDGVYLGAPVARALGALAVVPGVIAHIQDLDTWRYLSLRCLLDADDLSLISVWSPTFLSTLLDGLEPSAEALIRDVERGTVTVPGGIDAGLHFPPRPQRARQIRAALSGATPDTEALWPKLTLLSCWSHGSAARYLPAVSRLLPHATIQGKGLLATEGVVSVPFGEDRHPVLAVNSGFFEFLDSAGRSQLCHEVEDGQHYRVLLTTHAGLYRYDLGDRVRVHCRPGLAPALEFLGRSGAVSDLCGEKITEQQVQECLEDTQGFALLAPTPGDRPHYHLVLDAGECDPAAAQRLAARLDRRLRGNPHYDHARKLGQLGPILTALRPRALAAYLRWLTGRGRRLGDIKPPVLYRGLDWERIFEVD